MSVIKVTLGWSVSFCLFSISPVFERQYSGSIFIPPEAFQALGKFWVGGMASSGKGLLVLGWLAFL